MGPFLRLSVGVGEPGDAVPGARASGWSLEVATAVPVRTVELVVNGEVVWSEAGPDEPGRRRYAGRVSLPPGGWVAARARGGPAGWPAMDAYAFAHTAPIWIARVGTFERGRQRSAARDLLRWMDVADAGSRKATRGRRPSGVRGSLPLGSAWRRSPADQCRAERQSTRNVCRTSLTTSVYSPEE